jgi:hypothetical protein
MADSKEIILQNIPFSLVPGETNRKDFGIVLNTQPNQQNNVDLKLFMISNLNDKLDKAINLARTDLSAANIQIISDTAKAVSIYLLAVMKQKESKAILNANTKSRKAQNDMEEQYKEALTNLLSAMSTVYKTSTK